MELHPFIKPLAGKETPVVPNFFGVFMSSESRPHEAEQQARYAGAIGARALHKLRSFAIEDPEILYNNEAYTITAICDAQAGIIKLYAHRPIKPLVHGGSMEYRMTLARSSCMDESPDTFRQGVTAFRNAREWAMKKGNECIAAANAKAHNTATTQNTISTSVPDLPASPGYILS